MVILTVVIHAVYTYDVLTPLISARDSRASFSSPTLFFSNGSALLTVTNGCPSTVRTVMLILKSLNNFRFR